jgi:hypothetical protein
MKILSMSKTSNSSMFEYAWIVVQKRENVK